MKKMHVAVYYNNRDIRIEEMPKPEINDDEILVKVQASGICGSDLMEWYRIKKAPVVLGHEITGDIVKIGKKVKKYKIGDWKYKGGLLSVLIMIHPQFSADKLNSFRKAG